VRDELFVSLNDVTPVSALSFYVTNDHHFARGGIMQLLEDLSGLCISSVVFYDGLTGRAHSVIRDVCYGNGIHFSAGENLLFLASSTHHSLYTYNASQLSHPTLINSTVVGNRGTALDNIYASGNYFYLGGHQNQLHFLLYSRLGKESHPSPSIVYRYDRRNGAIDVLYENDGVDLSGVSIAAPLSKDALLIGPAVDQSVMLHCTNDVL